VPDGHVVPFPAECRADRSDLPVLTTVTQVVRLIQTTGDLFLRIGADMARSPRDPESGYRLPGAPCHTLVPETWWMDNTATWVARQLVTRSYLVTGNAQAEVLTGAVVGRDVDGRPLVAPAHALGLLAPEAFRDAESVYAAWRCRGW